VSYATDFDETYTALGSVSAPGRTSYLLPSEADGSGVVFQAIRFRLTLSRGANPRRSPDVENVTLLWRRKLPVRWRFDVTLDLSREYGGRSPRQMRAALMEAVESAGSVGFTFRDDDTETRNYRVDVRSVAGIEFTGHNEAGEVKLELLET
jgi:hypothetical protein